MSRVTIKSIARDLGISHMTVSRALSNHPNVQKETREAVQKRAREVGYVKSAAAMAMRGDAPRIVGLLLPNIVNEFYARFANALAQACDAQGLQLIIHLTNDDLNQESDALDRLREIQATTVVMVPAPGNRARAPKRPEGLRVIELIRQSGATSDNPSILVDDAPALRAACMHLAQTGHKKIAYIGAGEALSSGRKRRAAFLQGLQEAGIAPMPALIRTGAPSFDMARAEAQQLIREGKLSALVCGGFEISNGALSAFMEAHVDPNRDITFVGYGDPSFYSWISGGVSTIRVPVKQLSDCAVSLIGAPELAAVSRGFAAQLILRSLA